jgi:transcriptional regulator of acetoin/glycerol metabolism
MRLVFLYDAYHRVQAAFDSLVVDQLAAGDTPVPVPFARESLHLLRSRGFEAEDAVRLFAIFFPNPRAAHFIDRGLIGPSAAMKSFRRRLWENVFTHDIRTYERVLWNRMEDFSTLLLGETGTGKGPPLRDRALGVSSRSTIAVAASAKASRVDLSRSTFPNFRSADRVGTLRSSQRRFHGAVEAYEGVLARCSPYGAIFLDEIGDVTVPVQIKLLQVLQVAPSRRSAAASPGVSEAGSSQQPTAPSGTPRRGSSATTSTTGSARMRSSCRRCASAFAEDRQEFEELLAHLLQRLTGEGSVALLRDTRAALLASVGREYAWPGNVRELEQAARRILLTKHYEPSFVLASGEKGPALAAALQAGTLDADALLGGYCTLLYEQCRNLEEVARRTQLDRRTVKRYLGSLRRSSARFNRQ